MRFDPARCPECGDLPKGTCDVIPAIALLYFDDDDDAAEFAGESEVLWDGQETPTNADGLIDVICPNGHVWQAELEG
ncbi:MAG TPA: hypothetical protein VHV55_01895 [Pirellulales bacterium]|nr:hypothetical protein [Pirellulales bacterium]